MLLLLTLLVINANYFYINSELPLNSYTKEVGEFKEGEDIDNELTRWFINTSTNNCETFQYRGIKGNFNNFRTEFECNRHMENPISDKIKGCEDGPSVAGVCNAALITNENDKYKWSWNKGTPACEKFAYSGCGGNRNRYDSEEECNMFCYNEQYGKPDNAGNLDQTKKELYKLPNYHDCHLKPDLEIEKAEIVAVALLDEKQCVYAAAGLSDKSKPIRGAFATIQDCIDKCFPDEHDPNESSEAAKMKQRIPGCSVVQPNQFQKTTTTENPDPTPEIRFFYDHSDRSCKRFESWPGDFDKTQNNFPSAEICQSYCGWWKAKITDGVERQQACLLLKEGEYSAENNKNGKLNVKRWYFNSSPDKFKCESFMFGGINGNSNNFKSFTACKEVCWKRMDPEENDFAVDDKYSQVTDNKQPTT